MSRAPRTKLSDIAPDSQPLANGHGDEVDVLNCLRNGAWLSQQQHRPVEWTIGRLIPEGLTFLVGAPKVGKSWLNYECALGAAKGAPVLGQPVSQRPVLHLALEDSDRRLKERAGVLGHDPTRLPAEWEYVIRIPEGIRASDVIHAWLDKHIYDRPMVIIDTLGKIRGGGKRLAESAYDYDYRVGSALKRTIDKAPGGSLVVIHHIRKASSPDFIDDVSGTHGLAGAADTIIVVRRGRNSSQGSIHVTGRDIDEAAYATSFDAGRWRLEGGDYDTAATAFAIRVDSERLSDRMIEVVTYVNTYPEPVTARDVARALTDMDEATAKTYLWRAHKTGRIDKEGRGRYSASR